MVSGCIDFETRDVVVDDDSGTADFDSGIVHSVLGLKKPLEGVTGKFLKISFSNILYQKI